MTTFPTPQPDQGATNPPDPPEDATASGNDGSGRLVAEVARALGCVCTGICHHVGPARYCAEHAPDRSSTRAVPAAHGGDAP